ncbi:putative defensin, plant [Medicago truncatula]|uniref:Putative defensin, plant n=1 Tax=Medicago truncatula TaxID=3880 RepID=A0A396GI98_MEDTR|nr:putative defensin, plant [Medicago truncatula]
MAICSTRCLFTFLVFFCLVFHLISAEVRIAAAICQQPSGTWSGPCVGSSICNDQCREREGAVGGGCHILACYCHFFCNGD